MKSSILQVLKQNAVQNVRADGDGTGPRVPLWNSSACTDRLLLDLHSPSPQILHFSHYHTPVSIKGFIARGNKRRIRNSKTLVREG